MQNFNQQLGKVLIEIIGGALTGAVSGAFLGAILSLALWGLSAGGFWVFPESGDMAYALTLGLVEGAVLGGLLIICEICWRSFPIIVVVKK